MDAGTNGADTTPEDMVRFYFHLRDGEDLLMDPEGREADHLGLVPQLALKDARSIISQDALGGKIRLDQVIEVIDMRGQVVHHLDFRDAITIIHRSPDNDR